MTTIRKEAAKLPNRWNRGEPPHAGWWNASAVRAKDVWRWWNGKVWSWGASENSRSASAGKTAKRDGTVHQATVEWRAAWPAGARVARINTETGECTGTGPCPYEAAGLPWPFKKDGAA